MKITSEIIDRDKTFCQPILKMINYLTSDLKGLSPHNIKWDSNIGLIKILATSVQQFIEPKDCYDYLQQQLNTYQNDIRIVFSDGHGPAYHLRHGFSVLESLFGVEEVNPVFSESRYKIELEELKKELSSVLSGEYLVSK